MALIVGCDVCGKYMKTIPWERRSEISQKMVCPECKKKQEKLEQYITKAKSRIDRKIMILYNEAKEELETMIADLVKDNQL